jgi:hypothetical protein
MAKRVKQVRYYEDSSTKNYPDGSNGVKPQYRNLISGTAFSQYMPIIQLGI